MSVGNDRMAEMFFLTLYIFLGFVWLVYEIDESERSLLFTSPELSPTLVLVSKCLTVAHLVGPPTIAPI